MFGLFKSKKPAINEASLTYNSIGVDMHSHVLPGIDDGAKNLEESIALIRAMMGVGIRKIIATPHIMIDYYRNTPETIHNASKLLKTELVNQQIAIEIEAAAEYFFDEHFVSLIDKNDILTFGNKHVLFEFSFVSPPPVIMPSIQRLMNEGYQPVLAHPERYPYYTTDQYKNLKDWGCMLQINTISLTGYYGAQSKKIAETLVDQNMVDLISSDMHHLRHADAFKHALKMPYVQKLLEGGQLKNNLLL